MFDRCSSEGYAGAIALVQSTINLGERVRFQSCQAGYSGGAMWVSDGQLMVGSNFTFANNTAFGGGAIAVIGGTAVFES